MGDRPAWMDYIDLAAKIAVPLAIFFATAQFNQRTALAHAEENCLDLQIKLFGLGCGDANCTVTATRATTLLGFDRLIGERCKRAGIEPVQQVRQVLVDASKQVTEASLSADLQRAGGKPLPKAAAPASSPVQLAPQTQAELGPVGAAGPGGPGTASPVPAPVPVIAPGSATVYPRRTAGPRIFVQITNPAQREAAVALIDRISDSTLGGVKLAAFGPEYVRGYPLTHTELRCLKTTDCTHASDLAAYIGSQLNTAVTVRDLSARYNANPKVPRGNYELWFASNYAGAPLFAQ